MKRIAMLLLVSLPLLAEDGRLWKASLVALAAGQAADIVSSLPHPATYENNPRLRNANGDLAVGKAIAIKGGLAVGGAAFQYWAVRRWPYSKAAKIFTVVNFGMASVHFGVAVRNWRMR